MPDWRTDRSSAGAAIGRVTKLLEGAGIAEPGRDARLLVGAALGVEQAALLRMPEARLSVLEEQRLSELVQRRLAREPISRILGRRGFFGREFDLSPATLDPRPESETLIEVALDQLAGSRERDRPMRILDVGTGSGCLLVTLLAELPGARGIGTDIDPAALEVAARNAERHGVEARASFIAEGSLSAIAGPFDLLISNPPYIKTAEVSRLEPEVSIYDPHLALDGGPDGLAMYREIAANLRRLVPAGNAVLEVGWDQADRVCDLLRGISGPDDTAELHKVRDLDGRERCVAWKARRTQTPIGAAAWKPTKALGIW
jgi:release factor glutamine methyltransferase